MQELVERSSVGVSGPTDPDVLPEPQVLHLVPDPGLLPVSRPFGLVGFDAADVVGGALHQGLDQTVGLFLGGLEVDVRLRDGPQPGFLSLGGLTLILLLAVVGRPRFSASRFSGNRALMNGLTMKSSQRETLFH